MDIRSIVAGNVRRLRHQNTWSQEELAHRAGLDRTFISQIERGVKNATIQTIAKLALALECEPADLLTR